jgi:hypothetical protein
MESEADTRASRARRFLVRSLGLSRDAFWDDDLESGDEVDEPNDEHLKFIVQLCSLACILSLVGIALVSVMTWALHH